MRLTLEEPLSSWTANYRKFSISYFSLRNKISTFRKKRKAKKPCSLHNKGECWEPRYAQRYAIFGRDGGFIGRLSEHKNMTRKNNETSNDSRLRCDSRTSRFSERSGFVRSASD